MVIWLETFEKNDLDKLENFDLDDISRLEKNIFEKIENYIFDFFNKYTSKDQINTNFAKDQRIRIFLKIHLKKKKWIEFDLNNQADSNIKTLSYYIYNTNELVPWTIFDKVKLDIKKKYWIENIDFSIYDKTNLNVLINLYIKFWIEAINEISYFFVDIEIYKILFKQSIQDKNFSIKWNEKNKKLLVLYLILFTNSNENLNDEIILSKYENNIKYDLNSLDDEYLETWNKFDVIKLNNLIDFIWLSASFEIKFIPRQEFDIKISWNQTTLVWKKTNWNYELQIPFNLKYMDIPHILKQIWKYFWIIDDPKFALNDFKIYLWNLRIYIKDTFWQISNQFHFIDEYYKSIFWYSNFLNDDNEIKKSIDDKFKKNWWNIQDIICDKIDNLVFNGFLDIWSKQIFDNLWIFTNSDSINLKNNIDWNNSQINPSIEKIFWNDKRRIHFDKDLGSQQYLYFLSDVEKKLKDKLNFNQIKQNIENARNSWNIEMIKKLEKEFVDILIFEIHLYPRVLENDNPQSYQPQNIIHNEFMICLWKSIVSHVFLEEIWIKHNVVNQPWHSTLMVYIWEKKYLFDPTNSQILSQIDEKWTIWTYNRWSVNFFSQTQWREFKSIEIFYNELSSEDWLISQILINKSTYLVVKWKYIEAEQYLLRALKLNPNSLEAYNNIAALYWQIWLYELAEKYYKLSLEKFPINDTAKIWLIWINIQNNYFIKNPIKFYETVKNLDSQNKRTIFNLLYSKIEYLKNSNINSNKQLLINFFEFSKNNYEFINEVWIKYFYEVWKLQIENWKNIEWINNLFLYFEKFDINEQFSVHWNSFIILTNCLEALDIQLEKLKNNNSNEYNILINSNKHIIDKINNIFKKIIIFLIQIKNNSSYNKFDFILTNINLCLEKLATVKSDLFVYNWTNWQTQIWKYIKNIIEQFKN